MLLELHDKLSTKTKVLVGLLLLALMLIGLSIHTYNAWHGRQYFGDVVNITDTHITISDKKTGTRSILIDQETVVKKGRASGVALKEGMSVIITTLGTNNEHASLIRIVERPILKKSPSGLIR